MKKVDIDYDYSSQVEPITYELIKETLVEAIKSKSPDFDFSDPKNIENIDFYVKREMFEFYDHLFYLEDDEEIFDIIDGTYE